MQAGICVQPNVPSFVTKHVTKKTPRETHCISCAIVSNQQLLIGLMLTCLSLTNQVHSVHVPGLRHTGQVDACYWVLVLGVDAHILCSVKQGALRPRWAPSTRPDQLGCPVLMPNTCALCAGN